MPLSIPCTLRRLSVAASALAALLAATVAHASDGVPAHGTAREESKAAVTNAAVASAPASSTSSGEADPMARLRQRLSGKLPLASSGGEAGVLSVTTKPGPAKPHAAETVATSASPHGGRRKTAVVADAAPHRAADPAHWSYEGSANPEAWGNLKPEFAKCSTGTRQSPIDIQGGIRVDLEPVQFDYKPSPFRVLDNGHTVQVNVGPGNFIEVNSRRFELVQFHFHRPSEERIDGKQFDMVAHLVHKDLGGRLAVVAVLLERGSAHAVVQNVWNNLPLEKGEELAARGMLNVADLLPTERGYFTYMGSLTTPPCSEGVLWMVMKTPMPVSDAQIGIFAHLYPMNARPLQTIAGRLIKQSN